MKILICGSRHFNDYDLLKKEVLNALPIGNYVRATIISGHARGADTLGERFAEEMQWELDVYPADWETYGKRAGPIRNTQMLREGKPDMVIAFRGPNSRGTQNMINQARKAGVEVVVVDVTLEGA
jgi:hypothetical protein